MRIQHNIPAMNAYRNYNSNVKSLQKNLEKLSSGYRINRAGDDAAGLAISEKMRAQITGLETAQKNAKDGISLVQTAEGALTEVHDMLNRMYELAEQSANGTYQDEVDREQLQKEVESLTSEIDRISKASNFNGINLLDGSLGMSKNIEFGTIAATAAAPVSGAIKTSMAATAAAGVVGTNTILHADSKAAQRGTFTIDVSQVTISKGAAAGKFQLKIGGTAIASCTATSTKALNGKDIASMIADAFDGSDQSHYIQVTGGNMAVAANANAVAVGDAFYKATDNGNGTVTFDLAGYCTTAKAIETIAANSAQATLADVISKISDTNLIDLGKSVAIASNSSGTVTNGENVSTTNVTSTSKEKAATFGNTFLTLDMAKIKDGMQLTIAGQTKTFAIGSNSSVTVDANTIDLKAYKTLDKDAASGAPTADQQKDIMETISQAFAGNPNVTVGIDSAKTDNGYGYISLAEKTDGAGKSAAATDVQEKMKTLNGFKELVSVTNQATKAGVSIALKSGATLSEGEGLTVNDQRYVFTNSDKAGTTEDDTTYIKLSDGMKGLSTALTTAGIGNKIDGNKITIDAKSDGSTPSLAGKGLTLQIGEDAQHFNRLNINVKKCDSKSIGVDGDSIDIGTQDGAAAALDKIKNAINYVSDVRGSLGSTQNRLEHTINNLSVMHENIQDAEATIRDVDVAEEMMAYTKNNILVQSAQAMLAQANQLPQGVLQLLG